MTTKQKPATPLPWHDLSLSWVQPIKGETNASYDQLPKNCTFVLHAANAYPRLVEALRDYLIQTSEYLNDYRKDLPDATYARTLLRELGED